MIILLVPYVGGWFLPILGQEKYEFLSSTVMKIFNENSSNQFYIHISLVCISYIYIFYLLIFPPIKVYSM